MASKEDVLRFIREGILVFSNLRVLLPLLAFSLIAMCTDISSFKIPDKLTNSFLILRLIVALPFLGRLHYALENQHFEGMLVGLFIFLVPALIVNKKMGGDIKFLRAYGFWTGPKGVFIFASLATFSALVKGIVKKIVFKKDGKAPFAIDFFIATVILGIVSFII